MSEPLDPPFPPPPFPPFEVDMALRRTSCLFPMFAEDPDAAKENADIGDALDDELVRVPRCKPRPEADAPLLFPDVLLGALDGRFLSVQRRFDKWATSPIGCIFDCFICSLKDIAEVVVFCRDLRRNTTWRAHPSAFALRLLV